MRALLIAALTFLIGTNSLWAVGTGAFTNQVVGSKALGMGNAFVATADDPSAVFFNPAGLTQLESPEISFGLAPHFYATTYQLDNGNKDRTQDVNPIVPNLYAAVPFQQGKWAVGLGVNFPLGLVTKWGDNSPLRYVATETSLRVTQVSPTLSYKVNDSFSVGAGFIYSRIDADLKSRINLSGFNGGAAIPDGGKELKGDGTGFGYTASALYHFLDHHSVGINYHSTINTRIKGTVELTDLNDSVFKSVFGGTKYSVNTETDLDLPETLMFGYAFHYNQWTVESDLEWVDYAFVSELPLNFSGESDATRLSILNAYDKKRDYHSVWNFGFGTNYKFNETWQARGGFYYFPSVVPEHTWDPSIPDSARTAFTFGGSYTYSFLTVDLAYNLAIFHDRTIHNDVGALAKGDVDGQYSTTAHIISLNLTYKFNTKL